MPNVPVRARVRRAARGVAALVLIVGLLAPTGAAAANGKPAITIGTVTIDGAGVHVPYTVNRGTRQIASTSCWFDGAAPSSPCGVLIASTKSSATYRIDISSLPGVPTPFHIRVGFSDGGSVEAIN